MIIECQKCKSTFEIDANLIKPNGSKVRCSVCQHTFVAHPSEPELFSETEINEEFQETLALDSSALAEQSSAEADEAVDDEFEKLFDDSIDEDNIETVNLDEEPPEETQKDPFVEEPPDVQTEQVIHEEDRTDEFLGGAEKIEPDKQDRRKPKSSKSRPFLAVLFILILILCGLLAIRQWAPHLIPESLSSLKPAPPKTVSSDLGVKRLVFKDVNGAFVESKELGRMFVIRGNVVNRYSQARSAVQIKGSILDDMGVIIKRKLVYAGNSLPDVQIKEMTLEQLNKIMGDQPGQGSRNQTIEPENSLSFMVIFENLPDNMSEFTVEAVKSIPAD